MLVERFLLAGRLFEPLFLAASLALRFLLAPADLTLGRGSPSAELAAGTLPDLFPAVFGLGSALAVASGCELITAPGTLESISGGGPGGCKMLSLKIQ